MNGQYYLDRRLRVSNATQKQSGSTGGGMGGGFNMMTQNQGMGAGPVMPVAPPLDPTNATVFIGNLVLRDETEIRRVFDAYGTILRVKIVEAKNCGFVDFSQRESAEMAIQQLNGTTVGGQRVRLSWGHGGGAQAQTQTVSATTPNAYGGANSAQQAAMYAQQAHMQHQWQQYYQQQQQMQQQQQQQQQLQQQQLQHQHQQQQQRQASDSLI
jgi:RNA recognition motif-containing protein